MAIAKGDVVSPHLASGTTKAQPQPPRFGVVDNAPGDIDVLWEDGKLVTGIDPASLDKIEAPAVDALSGQRVIANLVPTGSVQGSADYQGVVVDLYKRDPAGSGSPGNDQALVKLLSSGLFVEVDASDCSAVAGGS